MGLDFEMQIYEHYFEVMEVIENLFEHIFTGLATRYGEPTSHLFQPGSMQEP